jgi:predicted type IV restriction endonuclease
MVLNLPPFDIRLIRKAGKAKVFDEVRNKYVALTPEEWVRQHFVHYLITCKGYPRERIANEVSISLNGTAKRCDTVVYDPFLRPVMLIEYKAPTVTLDAAVMEQAARYNMSLQVDYLILTNGLTHLCCRLDYPTRSHTFLNDLPPCKQ